MSEMNHTFKVSLDFNMGPKSVVLKAGFRNPHGQLRGFQGDKEPFIFTLIPSISNTVTLCVMM